MITTWSLGEPGTFMPEAILTDLSALIRRHPWWQARSRLVLAMLERHSITPPARVLDAGCGWGVTLDALEQRGYEPAGIDVSRQALERLDRPGRMLIEADLTCEFAPAIVSQSAFDAVLALDVIEHIDDDAAALANLARLVRPGGIMIVSVPALPDLFSEFDTVQGHRRRYLPEQLRAAFDQSGLAIEQLFWWGSWLVPLFRARRRRASGFPDQTPEAIYERHLRLPPWPIPAFFRAAFALEQARAIRGKTKQGTSLVAVASELRVQRRMTTKQLTKNSRRTTRIYSIPP